MDRTEHFAKATDGTRIFWTEAGHGAPAVVLTDGIGCAGYVWRLLEPALARRARVLHWNYRGHGRSDAPRDPEHVTLGDCVGDLLRVLEEAGEPRAIVAGHSMGVQVALEAHRVAPERIAGLVLLCGAPGLPLDTFHDSPLLRLAFPWARAAMELRPDLARSFFRTLVPTNLATELALTFEVDRTRVAREDIVRYLADLSAVDPILFARMLTSAADHDASDHLRAVSVPTLVVAGERDTFTPMRRSAEMATAIAASELVVVPGGTHVAPLEAPELVENRLMRFLDAHFGPAEPARAARAAPDARRRSEG